LALFRFCFPSFRRLGLSAGRFFLTLEISLLFEHVLFKAQQTGVGGHGLQALFNVDQAHLQRAFLLGALGLFEELLGLQLRLPKLLLWLRAHDVRRSRRFVESMAAETADIVLLADQLDRVPTLIELSRSSLGVIKTNVIFSMSWNVLSVLLSMTGAIGPVFGAVMHELSALPVVANSARLINWRSPKQV